MMTLNQLLEAFNANLIDRQEFDEMAAQVPVWREVRTNVFRTDQLPNASIYRRGWGWCFNYEGHESAVYGQRENATRALYERAMTRTPFNNDLNASGE